MENTPRDALPELPDDVAQLPSLSACSQAPDGRKVAMTSFLDSALTLITLASLFILGPALGHAVVSCFDWQNWSVPVQHLVVGLCTIAAVSGMILAYGLLWEWSPKSVAWYGWIHEATVAGRVNPAPPTEIRQPLKK
jgi:hypothetical protein